MRVLIFGTGIAGLSLAPRLRQRGFARIVVERSPRLRDGGYMPADLPPYRWTRVTALRGRGDLFHVDR